MVTHKSIDLRWVEATLWLQHHDCNSLIRQSEQLQHKQTEQRGENIWFKESLLVGNQLKPEQCGKRGSSHCQSKPLIFQGTDHDAAGDIPINRAFSKKTGIPSTGDRMIEYEVN